MSIFRTTLCASAILLSASYANAETTLDQSHQTDLSLTIYQNGLGFVKDKRRVELSSGKQTIAFEDVSTQLAQDSLLISGNGFSISERRFAFDLLNQHTLLEKSLGKNVSFRRLNPVTGKDELIKAKILSTQGGIIFERDGMIEAGQPGRLVLNKLPEGLRPRPALMADLIVEKDTSTDLALAYLSSGLNWHSSYSAEVSDDGKTIMLKSWANLTNTSGADYKNVDLKVSAGKINRRTPSRPGPTLTKAAPRAMAMAMDSAPEMTASPSMAVGGMHLYTLPNRVDLNHNETKQVSLMKPLSFKSKRVLVKRFRPVYGAFPEQPVTPTHPNIELSFKNNSGQPLPSGITRLYRNDASGQLQFVGEDTLKQTANGLSAKLNPGQSFDVSLLRTQTSYEPDGKHRFEAAYKVVIKNSKDIKETVRVIDSFPGTWELEKASDKPANKSTRHVSWEFDIPAGGEKVLTYHVAVRTR